MSSLQRVALVAFNVALTLVPMMGTGCVQLSQPQTACRPPIPVCDPRMNHARLAESRGNLMQAKNLYAEIIRQNPRNVECAHRLGVVCTQLNRYDEAEIYFRQAYAIAPNDAELLSDMGYSAFQRKDFEKADAFLEQSVRLNGNDQRTINNLAIARAWRGKDDSSLATFRMVHNEAEALRRLTAIQVARGDNVRVQAKYDAIAQVIPRSPGVSIDVTQTKMTVVDSTPVDLPSPEFTAPKIPSVQVETPEQTAIFVTSVASEVTIDLPVPLPLAPVELTPDVRLNPVEELVQSSDSPLELANDRGSEQLVEVTDSLTLTPPSLELLAVPLQQDDVGSDSVLAESESVVEIVIPPSPALLPETPANSPRPVPNSGPLTCWRKTLPSRGGLDGQPAKLNEAEIRQVSASAGHLEEMKKDWGICLVTLFEEKRLELGLPQYVMEYQSRRYRFASAEAMDRFRMAPHQFLPVADGLDIVSVRSQRGAVPGSLNFAQWYRRKLYLFSCRENAEAFSQDPQQYSDTE